MKKAGSLRDVRDGAAPPARVRLPQQCPVDAYLTATGLDQAEQEVRDRALASALRPRDRNDLIRGYNGACPPDGETCANETLCTVNSRRNAIRGLSSPARVSAAARSARWTSRGWP